MMVPPGLMRMRGALRAGTGWSAAGRGTTPRGSSARPFASRIDPQVPEHPPGFSLRPRSRPSKLARAAGVGSAWGGGAAPCRDEARREGRLRRLGFAALGADNVAFWVSAPGRGGEVSAAAAGLACPALTSRADLLSFPPTQREMGRGMRGISVIIAAAMLWAGGASAQTLCDDANTVCSGRIDPSCLTRGRVGAAPVGLDDVAAKGDCAAQFDSYRQCLTDVAAECARPPSAASNCTNEDARQMWPDISTSDDPETIEAFLRACPNAPQAELARLRLRRLQAAQEPAVAPACGA